MASTNVMNWARKPGWRIAAKDRFADGEGLTEIDFVSLMKGHQLLRGAEPHPAARFIGYV
jgi:hypothetical protein